MKIKKGLAKFLAIIMAFATISFASGLCEFNLSTEEHVFKHAGETECHFCHGI